MTTCQTDYLVIGSGAVGLAFADALLDQSPAHITIVDRYAQPGGHWTKAYPFVRLHQPSAYYGVTSMPLGADRITTSGPNAGLYEVSSKSEILAYFERVMEERLLQSGRVQYLPMTNYLGKRRAVSLVSDVEYDFTVRRKVVDTTFLDTELPATRAPAYKVAEDVELTTPDRLPDTLLRSAGSERELVIVGAGKTAIDVILWLRALGLAAAQIVWVVPRDSWFSDRVTAQPGPDFFNESIGALASRLEAAGQACTVDDLFSRFERSGGFMRVDPSVQPRMFHFATITRAELEVLRTIKRVIRQGRVREVNRAHVVLEHASLPIVPGSIIVDCSASAFTKRTPAQVFQNDTIVPQVLRAPYVCLSAAITAYVEANFANEREKNAICAPVPLPNTPGDMLKTFRQNLVNGVQWANYPALAQWVGANRLNPAAMQASNDLAPEQMAQLRRVKEATPTAIANLGHLIKGKEIEASQPAPSSAWWGR